jgi:diaphanous 1
MSASLESELHSMLAFFGENPDSPEAPKSEDFFGLILSFSSSLQKAALEVHDTEAKKETPEVKIEAAEEPAEEMVRAPIVLVKSIAVDCSLQTVKMSDVNGQAGKQAPPSSMGRAAGLSVGRGDLDQAIRSMRDGRRRARPQRPASKIFVDGTRASRLFD